MKKIIYIILAAVLVVCGYYLYMYWALGNDNVGQVIDDELTYSQGDIGLEFDYPEGPEGYIVDEGMLVDLGTGLIKNIILTRTEDAQQELPVSGETPPVIVLSVFENPKKQFPRTWADQNAQYSNINLLRGEVEETVVGGANAIWYMTDGLYASENVIVAHSDYLYVVTGQFIDQDSPIRRDYQTLVDSIRFIPIPGQN